MSKSLLAKLTAQRSAVNRNALQIIARANDEFRSEMTGEETEHLQALETERDDLDKRIKSLTDGEKLAAEADAEFVRMYGGPEDELARARGGVGSHPLEVRADVLDAVQEALASRTTGKWEARAALTTGETGGRRAWASNTLRGPRMLHVAAGVPTGSHDAVTADYLKAGAITAAAGVGETVAVSELANLTKDTATLQRYGRWTNMSREANIASDAAGTISLQHRIALARDLDDAFITQLLTPAVSGTDPIASTTGLASLRMAVATVCDATGAEPGAITIAVPPAMAPVLQEVQPTGGSTVAEPFTTFAGARVYFSSFVTADTAVVFDGQGFRYFEAQGVTFETDVDIKTSVLLFATSLIGGYGYNLLPGAAVRADLSPGA